MKDTRKTHEGNYIQRGIIKYGTRLRGEGCRGRGGKVARRVKDKCAFESAVADLFRGPIGAARSIRDYFACPRWINEEGTLVMDHDTDIMQSTE